jgi:hypothetical protein
MDARYVGDLPNTPAIELPLLLRSIHRRSYRDDEILRGIDARLTIREASQHIVFGRPLDS